MTRFAREKIDRLKPPSEKDASYKAGAANAIVWLVKPLQGSPEEHVVTAMEVAHGEQLHWNLAGGDQRALVAGQSRGL